MSASKASFWLMPVPIRMTWELVTTHIEEAILNGIVGPGERLPPERELAKQLSVSRSVLRDALKDLAHRGLIRTTQGGGNFVNQIIGKQMSDPLAALLKDSPMPTWISWNIERNSKAAPPPWQRRARHRPISRSSR
jgi:DNA-binding transcriptional MocR family regulator